MPLMRHLFLQQGRARPRGGAEVSPAYFLRPRAGAQSRRCLEQSGEKYIQLFIKAKFYAELPAFFACSLRPQISRFALGFTWRRTPLSHGFASKNLRRGASCGSPKSAHFFESDFEFSRSQGFLRVGIFLFSGIFANYLTLQYSL